MKNILSQEVVIKKFVLIHKDKYDYSLVKYEGSNKKIKIICKEHGVFEQLAHSHSSGKGCKLCAMERNINSINLIGFEKELDFFNKNKIKKQEFKKKYIEKRFKIFNTVNVIEEFKKIHGDKYIYDLVEYKRNNFKVKIICPIHGVFEQTPEVHKRGCGCSNCKKGVTGKLTWSFVKNQFIDIHKDLYDYSLFKYEDNYNRSIIICKEHGKFKQSAGNHKRGRGCPRCAKGGFKRNIPGVLYYVKIEKNGQIAYKIGITNRTVKERFSIDFQYVTILKEWYYVDGEECYNQEQKILKEYSFAKFDKKNFLSNGGNEELFNTDILLLDNI